MLKKSHKKFIMPLSQMAAPDGRKIFGNGIYCVCLSLVFVSPFSFIFKRFSVLCRFNTS